MADGAAQEKKTGGMIALLPADPAALVIDHVNAEPAADQHLTLLYLGADVTGWSEATRDELVDLIAAAVAEVDGPITANVIGHATFRPDSDEPVAVHLIGDSDVLGPLHQRVTAAAVAALGEDLRAQHAPWIPHITGAYNADATALTYSGEVVLDRVVVVLAGERYELPLLDADGHLVEQVRAAYAHGWACSGGPMTDRVRAGCLAAIGWAREHRDAPDVLEVSIDLGSLEGTLAAVFQRREDLYQQHLALVTAAWRKAVAQLDVTAAVKAYARTIGIATEASADQGDDAKAQWQANAQAQARDLLHGIVDTTAPEYNALVESVAEALMDAQAEGHTGTVAMIADQMGVRGEIRFDLAFDDAHTELGKLADYWGEAQDWVGKVVNGAATDLGNALARVTADGGSFDELRSAALDALGENEAAVRSVDTLIDMAMSQSYSRGALDLYGREGVATVDYSTAGGDRVCPRCLDIESNNPWQRNECPQPAIHPFCRCVIMPENPLQAIRSFDLSKYLVGSQ